MSEMLQAAQARIAGWRHDPVKFVRDEFKVEPDLWQARALRAFARQDKMRMRIAMQACVGPGKSAVLAWMGWNFLVCYCSKDERGARHPSGLVTSESGDNLKDNLWKEFATWGSRSELLTREFEVTSERIFAKAHRKTWFLSARTWPKRADSDAQGRSLSGLHADFVLVLIDESGDIPPAVLRAAEQALSNCVWGRIVQAGNPTSHDGMLYHASVVQPHRWEVIKITGDPDDPERSPRIDIENAREIIADNGRENPWVKATLLGEFPKTAVNALFGPEDVDAAMKRHLRPDAYQMVQKRIGVDVARFGDDATILCPRQGLWTANMIEMRDQNSNQIAARLIQGKQRFGSEMELIDSTGGWASGVVDSCALGGVHLYEVNFGGKADDSRYFNKRAEMAFRAAENIAGGGALPNDPQLKRELCSLRYWFEKGALRVIEKKDWKKALQGHSPDRADAWFVTFAVVDLPARIVEGIDVLGSSAGKAISEWDPNADR